MIMLELVDVSLAFDGVRAVDHVSATVPAGQVTALIGPNGAGKTSLLNLICGVWRPESGTVWFRDQNVTGWPVHRRAARGLARTYQNLELFGAMTVREHLLVGRHRLVGDDPLGAALRLPRQVRAERAQQAAVDELLRRWDLSWCSDQPASALPHGIQRRVELVRALAGEPDLLLLDEPVAGLSRPEVAGVIEPLRALVAAGLTILLIEHDMETVAALADQVLVLAQGSLLAAGAPAAILSDPAVIAAYLGEEVVW
jgi:branched-chain amino acid transport system ATP-binding protein